MNPFIINKLYLRDLSQTNKYEITDSKWGRGFKKKNYTKIYVWWRGILQKYVEGVGLKSKNNTQNYG